MLCLFAIAQNNTSDAAIKGRIVNTKGKQPLNPGDRPPDVMLPPGMPLPTGVLSLPNM